MSDTFDALPATRWDRLTAVLEEVDPERVIDASRIIERQKVLGVSDTTLSQLIQLRYQDIESRALGAFVHLCVLKDSWLLWLRRTEECLRAHRAGHHGSKSRRDVGSSCGAARTTVHVDLHEFWDRNDGSLNVFRDGRLLCELIEESLSHTDAFLSLPAAQRSDSQHMSQLQYAMMFPSLPTSSNSSGVMWSFSGDASNDGAGRAPSTHSNPSSSPHSPVTTGKSVRTTRRTTNRKQVSSDLKKQEDSMRQAVSQLSQLNDLCATFLSWKERGMSREPFFPIQTLEHSAAPTNKDDLHLLLRLHWLSLALHQRVHNETVVPPPPTVSFLLHNQFQAPKTTLQPDEDSDIAVLVATQFTYFPQSHQLEILSPSPRKVSIRHPKAVAIQYDCVLVEKEAYVFDRQHHVFRPFWELMKRLLLLFEDRRWFFEMNTMQRELEKAIIGSYVGSDQGPSSLRRSPPVAQSVRRTSGSRDDRSRSTFELTVRTSTVRRGREAHVSPDVAAAVIPLVEKRPAVVKVEVPVSTVQRRRQKLSEPTAAPIAAAAASIVPSKAPPPAPAKAGASTSPAVLPPPLPEFPKRTAAASPTQPADNAGSQPVSASSRASVNDNDGNEEDLLVEASVFPQPTPRDTSSHVNGSHARADADDLDDADADDDDDRDNANSNSDGLIHSCTLSEIRDSVSVHPTIIQREQAVSGGRCGGGRRAQPPGSMESSVKPYFSEVGRRHQLNFSAEILHQGEENRLAVNEHHFRVSGKPIGKGAFGAVYRALDLETGITVAVKQSRYTLSGDAEDNVNWNELQLLSMLPAHPNVVTFHGASKEVETRQLLLVMEYASGGSIMTMYQDFWPMPEQLFFQHALEMARGLKHLHDHGVIHGDVKPENVLTRSNGSVALTDFGCSSVCGTADGTGAIASIVSSGAGMSNSLSGTPPYMAPEVIMGAVDTKSDVWAFACTLLQLWLWELPWSDGHEVDVMNVVPLLFYIGSQDVVPYSDAQIEMAPRWLQKIAARAFVRNVESRCNMSEVLSILTTYSAE